MHPNAEFTVNKNESTWQSGDVTVKLWVEFPVF